VEGKIWGDEEEASAWKAKASAKARALAEQYSATLSESLETLADRTAKVRQEASEVLDVAISEVDGAAPHQQKGAAPSPNNGHGGARGNGGGQEEEQQQQRGGGGVRGALAAYVQRRGNTNNNNSGGGGARAGGGGGAVSALEADQTAHRAGHLPVGLWGVGLPRLALSEKHCRLAHLCPVRETKWSREVD